MLTVTAYNNNNNKVQHDLRYIQEPRKLGNKTLKSPNT